MSKIDDALTHARAIECADLPGEQESLENYLKRAKIDWDLRGQHDPGRYVCASPDASEAQIEASGRGDVVREYLPRVLDYPHDTVLEIGAGFGRMTRWIAEYSKRVWGIDISPSLVRKAHERLGGMLSISIIEGDGITLNGIPNSIFDVAFEYLVFQHIPAEEIIISYIQEVWKKLKPGGVFIMHGRDVPASETGTSTGNTWHGCRCGPDLVRKGMDGFGLDMLLLLLLHYSETQDLYEDYVLLDLYIV